MSLFSESRVVVIRICDAVVNVSCDSVWMIRIYSCIKNNVIFILESVCKLVLLTKYMLYVDSIFKERTTIL